MSLLYKLCLTIKIVGSNTFELLRRENGQHSQSFNAKSKFVPGVLKRFFARLNINLYFLHIVTC